jgi:hypothetical protein
MESEKLRMLSDVIGGAVSDGKLKNLLAIADGDVQQAVALWFQAQGMFLKSRNLTYIHSANLAEFHLINYVFFFRPSENPRHTKYAAQLCRLQT